MNIPTRVLGRHWHAVLFFRRLFPGITGTRLGLLVNMAVTYCEAPEVWD